jgi:threonine dehydrogenase-like Zn-dependent dehydrogenase
MPPATMRAAVAQSGDSLAVESVPIPEPRRGELRVRVTACGICGSDLHLVQSGLLTPGRIPGHEIAGVVDALGPGVSRVSEGDHVAVEPFRSCGECDECRSGRDPVCRDSQLLGIQADGGLAEYIVVSERRIFPAPADLGPELTALAEPLAVSIHGLRRGGFQKGSRVLILGAGCIGLMGLFAARAMQAGEIWISARHPHQAALAKRIGATRVLAEAEAGRDNLERLGRSHPIDLVLETVGGRADTLGDGAAAVRPGGAVAVLGFFLGAIELDTLPLLMKEVSLIWSYCYHHGERGADFSDAVEFISRERELAALFTSASVPLDDVERAFELAGDKTRGIVKVSVLP